MDSDDTVGDSAAWLVCCSKLFSLILAFSNGTISGRSVDRQGGLI